MHSMVICAYDADDGCQTAACHRCCHHAAVGLCIANCYHRVELFYTLFIVVRFVVRMAVYTPVCVR